MKKHIYEIDFIRTICCLGIVIYHFACHTNSNLSVLTNTINSNGGSIIVTIFFIISGFVLYHNNKEIKSLKKFYWKRYKSVFPSFYLCWFIFYVINIIKVRTPFYAGNPLKMLLTLIGQDGYTQQRIINYYIVGEWFLGALIIVYALYPLLMKLHKKNSILTLLVLSLLTIIVHAFNVPVISPGFPGICESCLKLYLGILMYEQIGNINKPVIVASIIFIVIYSFIKINFMNYIMDIVYSTCLFIVLFKLASALFNKENNKFFMFIGGISYQIFLLQHQVINCVLEIYNPINTCNALLMMLVCVAITILFAYAISSIVKKLINNKLFIKLDKLFLE